MSSRTFRLPEAVRLRAQAQGEPGLRWIAGLAECVGYLEMNWAMRVGETLTGGSESLSDARLEP